MRYRLTKQGQDYFIFKYNINKNLVKTVENQVNFLRVVKSNNDYFTLLNNVFCNIGNTLSEVKQISDKKNKSKININEIIVFEIFRLFGPIKLENPIVKLKTKKQIHN